MKIDNYIEKRYLTKSFYAPYAIRSIAEKTASKHTWEFTMSRKRSSATFAWNYFLANLHLTGTTWFTPEKNLMCATFAEEHFQIKLVWSDTLKLTAMSKCTSALYVPKRGPSQQKFSWTCTWSCTMIRGRSSATSAWNCSSTRRPCKYTTGATRGRSRLCAKSAERASAQKATWATIYRFTARSEATNVVFAGNRSSPVWRSTRCSTTRGNFPANFVTKSSSPRLSWGRMRKDIFWTNESGWAVIKILNFFF